MNKFFLYFFFFLFFITNVYSQTSSISEDTPPIDGFGYYYTNGATFNGQNFFSVAPSYEEQDGFVYIEPFGKLHYWLYNTYEYHNGDSSELYNKFIPRWIEAMGYIIDFDNISSSEQDPEQVPSSIKALMNQRNCNFAVALYNIPFFVWVTIYEYHKSNNTYTHTDYPLIK